MPERRLEIPTLDEIRRVFGTDARALAPAEAPETPPGDTLENDDD